MRSRLRGERFKGSWHSGPGVSFQRSKRMNSCTYLSVLKISNVLYRLLPVLVHSFFMKRIDILSPFHHHLLHLPILVFRVNYCFLRCRTLVPNDDLQARGQGSSRVLAPIMRCDGNAESWFWDERRDQCASMLGTCRRAVWLLTPARSPAVLV